MSTIFDSEVFYGLKTMLKLEDKDAALNCWDIMEGKHSVSQKAVANGLDVFAQDLSNYFRHGPGHFVVVIGRRIAHVTNDSAETTAEFNLQMVTQIAIETSAKLKELGYSEQPQFHLVFRQSD